MPYLESLRNETKIPLIYVSHSLHELIRLADDILVIKDGQLQEFGRIEEVLNRAQYSLWPGDEVESLVYANLVEHDTKYGLTILDSDLGRLTVSALDVPLGQTVRVTLAARDVSITLEHQQSTSILNVFAAEVIDIQTIDKAQVLVRLRCGDTYVASRITRKSAASLNLVVGMQVFCQAKTVALL